MKKFCILLVLLLSIQMTAFAEIKDVTYTSDNEYKQTLDSGYDYYAYSGVVKFSVTDTDIEGAGCELRVNKVYHLPFDIPFVGDLNGGNFSMRIKGRGLVYGNYTLTPYVVINGEKQYAAPVNFTITETCVALTNLRLAYDQLQDIEFNEKEQAFINLVLPAVEDAIKDAESGAEITKEYVKEKYKAEIAEAKAVYDAMDYKTEKSPLMKKLNAIDKNARAFLTQYFGLFSVL